MSDSISLNDPDILLGKGMIGGAKRCVKRCVKSVSKKSSVKKSSSKKMRGGFFFESTPGDEYKCYSCVKVTPPAVTTTSSTPSTTVSSSEISSVPPENVSVTSSSQTGGSANVRKIYKDKLKALDVKQLRKMAENRGINIKKRKDGKIVYVKKATIIQKLCDFKHGKP